MNVEHQIVIDTLAKEFIPRVQELKNKQAYIELLCSSSWAELEEVWRKNPIDLDIAIKNLIDDLEQEFRNISKKADQLLEDKDTFQKLGPLANYIPDELLISRSENPPVISDAGVAFGLSKCGLGKVIEGRIETISSRKVAGSGQLILSGFTEQKDTDQALIGHTLLRSMPNVSAKEFRKWDLHLHSEGGKGPSAGLAIFASLISAYFGKVLTSYIAFTGELQLTGKIKPIGGLLPKSIAAYRASVKTIILPQGNKQEILFLPRILLDNINYKFIQTVEEAMSLAFTD